MAVEDVNTHESFIYQMDREVEYETLMDEEEEQHWMMNEAYQGVPVPKQSLTSRTDLVPCSILII